MSPRDKRMVRHQLKDAQRELKRLESLEMSNGTLIKTYRQKRIDSLHKEIAELKAIV
jgi:phage host-nuclease inhibitor protein Gam